jgi:ATP phosphoribosyltransferase
MNIFGPSPPQFCDWLIAKGTKSVTSTKHDYVFRADNFLWRKLAARIGA